MIRNPIPWPNGARCACAITFDMDADSVDVDVSIPLKLVPIDLHVGLTPERVVRHDLNAPRLGHATFNRCCDGIAGVPICAHFLARVEETMPADLDAVACGVLECHGVEAPRGEFLDVS